MEEQLFQILSLVQRLGVGLPLVAWVTIAGGVAGMAYVLRKHLRDSVGRGAAIFGVLAMAANLADYYATLYRNPDLTWEANPLWRNVIDRFGLTVALWYGLTGKLLVSVLAGQLFGFYLTNRERLFPLQARSLGNFVAHIGSCARTSRDRLLAAFTLFAFFFAGINLLYFYIAYVNWVDDPELLNLLPSAPVAIMLVLIVLTITFIGDLYWCFRRVRMRERNEAK